MNNPNFFDYLLVMLIRFKTYKLVGREYLRWLLNEGNDDCQFNKSVNWWRIHEKWGKLTVEPELDENTDDWQLTTWLIFFLVQNPVATKLEKANMMVLSKEMTDKDRSMKTQLLIRSSSDGDDKLSGEKVWKNNGFF